MICTASSLLQRPTAYTTFWKTLLSASFLLITPNRYKPVVLAYSVFDSSLRQPLKFIGIEDLKLIHSQ